VGAWCCASPSPPPAPVSAVEVDEDTLGDPEVTACVRNAVMLWRFAAPPRKVEVTFPFVFPAVELDPGPSLEVA
jgi:hypothetical protein